MSSDGIVGYWTYRFFLAIWRSTKGDIMHYQRPGDEARVLDNHGWATDTQVIDLVRVNRDNIRGGLVCLNSAARFDKWNRAAVR